MIDISTILRHNLVGKMLNHGLVFLINVLLVRQLGAVESGLFFNELYIINFIVFLGSFGLDYTILAILGKEPGAVAVVHRSLMLVAGCVTLVLCLFLILLPQEVIPFRQPAAGVVLFILGNILLLFYQAMLSATGNFNLQNVVLILTNSVFLIALGWSWVSDNEIPVMTLQIGYASLLVIQGITMLVLSFRKKVKSVSVNWGKYFRHGLVIMLSSLIYFLFLRLDNFFVAKYADSITLSNYVQCGKVGQYFLYFSAAISSTLIPFMSSEVGTGTFADWRKLVTPYVALLIVAAITIAIAGQYLFPLLFGSDFVGMYKLMLIFLPGFVCLGLLTMLNAAYISTGKVSKILLGDSLALAVLVLADLIVVPVYGATGAAIVSSSCYVLLLTFLAWKLPSMFEGRIKYNGT